MDGNNYPPPPPASDGAPNQPWLKMMPVATYTCGPNGLITGFNHRASVLWGRKPKISDAADRYCGSHRLFATNGAYIPHDRCWMALALHENRGFNRKAIVVERPDGSRRTALAHANPMHDTEGRLTGAINVLVDVTAQNQSRQRLRETNRKVKEMVQARTAALERTNQELRDQCKQLKTLRGMILICSWCKSICDETQSWRKLECYLHSHSEAEFTHGICPECAEKMYAKIKGQMPGSRKLDKNS